MLRLAAAVACTALVVGSANALNMYIERFPDRLMERTRNRPLATGRLSPDLALAFGVGLGLVSVPVLAIAVNAITGLLAAFALLSYVLVYTPLKRRTTASLLIGAVPGAIPPLLGWTAVTGRVEWPGLLLFGVLFLWQVPHFLAIATFRRDDYARAGLKILPVERGDRVTRVHVVAYLVALLAVSFALVASGVGGPFYLGAAVVLGAIFLGVGLWGLRPSAGVRWARGLFAVSIVYLVLLFAALMMSP
jgi:protoheme IX farnesyltransferase